MPPRTRAAGRGRASPNASDGASAQAGQPQMGIRGRGRGHGRTGAVGSGRGGPAPTPDTRPQFPEPQPNLGETAVEVLVAGFQELRQQLQQVQQAVAGLSRNRTEGVEAMATEEHIEVPQQERPPARADRGRRDVEVANFLKLKPPTFCGTDPKEDS